MKLGDLVSFTGCDTNVVCSKCKKCSFVKPGKDTYRGPIVRMDQYIVKVRVSGITCNIGREAIKTQSDRIRRMCEN